YNAVYRGKINYFSSKYKSIVMKFIHSKNAGISTKYYEWPGATRMLIPLTAQPQNDKLDSIDVDVISNKAVLSQVKKDTKHLQARKDMIDIKEQLLLNNKDELEKNKSLLQSQIEELDKEKKSVESKKITILQKEKEIDKTKEDMLLIPDSQKKELLKNDLETKQKQLEKEKEEIKKREEEILKKESEIEQQQKKLEDTEKKLAFKQKEIEDEKKDIALDEAKQIKPKDKETLIQKLEEKEKQLNEREDKLRSKEIDKNIYENKLYYLKIKEYLQDGHYNNEMVMIDPANQKILFKSPEKNICGKRYDIFSGGVVVITHKGSHSIGHRLTILDRNTLVPIVYGKDNIFWRSFIEIRDGNIYAIVIENGKFYLGCFDTNLTLIAKSQKEVNENTFISFWDNYIYINRVDKTIMVLNKKTLQLIGTIHP
ncbi:MAG: P83/100 family protein, partial [Bacteroidales bacterium]